MAALPIAPLRAASPDAATSQPLTAPVDPFRLTFVESKAARRAPVTASTSAVSPVRALLSIADIALVLALAAAGTWLFGKDIWQLAAGLALVALAIASLTGHGPAAWLFAQSAAALEHIRSRASAPASPVTQHAGARARRPSPSVASRLKAAVSFVHEYFDRLSYGATMTARNQRHRELIGVRRRRIESANSPGVDEAGII